MNADVPGYPGVRVHWAAAFESPEHAMVLDLAQALAHRLGDEEGPWGVDLATAAPRLTAARHTSGCVGFAAMDEDTSLV